MGQKKGPQRIVLTAGTQRFEADGLAAEEGGENSVPGNFATRPDQTRKSNSCLNMKSVLRQDTT